MAPRIALPLVLALAASACGPGVAVDDDSTSGAGSTTTTTTTAGASTTTDPPELIKGEVDEAALVAGVTVTLTPDGLGQVVVPMSTPIPEVPRDALEMEMWDAAAMLVTSNLSGASADLMAGFVEAALSQPGAFAWELDPTRTAVTLTFVNETPGGLVLVPGSNYTVQIAVTTNDYVERVSAISFAATVVEG